jgi:glycosyltransferase involved in cell wall biosynthesis
MITHLINYKDPQRGGAQKILAKIHQITGGKILCIADATFSFKPFALAQLYLKTILLTLKQRSHIVAHSRMYLPLMWFLTKCGVQTTYYCHATYRSAPWLMRLFKVPQYIAVSQSVKSYLITIGINKNAITVIYNPLLINGDQLDSDAVSDLSEYNEEKVFKVFSVGALESWKGFASAIKSLKLASDKLKIRIEYTVIGQGSEREDLELLASQLRSDRFEVFFLGHLPSPFSHVKLIKNQLIPSLEEGFGLVAIEGIYFEKRILYKKIPALIEVCGNDPLSWEYDRENDLIFRIKHLISGSSPLVEKNFFKKRKKSVELSYGCDRFNKEINNTLSLNRR